MAIRIGIAGVTGRMGRLLVEEARAAGAELAGGIGRAGSSKAAPDGVTLLADIVALAAASDIVIDFTNAAAARPYAAAMAASGKAWVLGTSGLSEADEAAVATTAERIPVVYASNFSAGVNLVLEPRCRPMPMTPRSWRCTIGRRWTRRPAPRSAWAVRSPRAAEWRCPM